MGDFDEAESYDGSHRITRGGNLEANNANRFVSADWSERRLGGTLLSAWDARQLYTICDTAVASQIKCPQLTTIRILVGKGPSTGFAMELPTLSVA